MWTGINKSAWGRCIAVCGLFLSLLTPWPCPWTLSAFPAVPFHSSHTVSYWPRSVIYGLAAGIESDGETDSVTKSGKEVIDRSHPALPDHFVDISLLAAHKIAIMQFDSRPLKNYWLSAAQWNHAYCQRHGHVFVYYSLEDHCHHHDEPLASAWCKVRAMLNAYEDFPDVDMFIYMDSDAVIDKRFADFSLNQMLAVLQRELAWNPEEKPIVFNQDGPCWWCTFIVKIGYKMCLNAGTVAWYRHPTSWKVLQEWWDSSMDPYETNPIKR